jgi:hypothetical protein
MRMENHGHWRSMVRGSAAFHLSDATFFREGFVVELSRSVPTFLLTFFLVSPVALALCNRNPDRTGISLRGLKPVPPCRYSGLSVFPTSTETPRSKYGPKLGKRAWASLSSFNVRKRQHPSLSAPTPGHPDRAHSPPILYFLPLLPRPHLSCSPIQRHYSGQPTSCAVLRTRCPGQDRMGLTELQAKRRTAAFLP